jgi:cation diffusion facilitator CzcD-associated flavoprotein CzcO
MAQDWDVVVVGAGVAGLAAARAAAEAGARICVIDRMGPGGVLMNLPALHDMPGNPNGMDYASALLDAAMEAGAELAVAEVTALTPGFAISTDDEAHSAKAVVLAVGLGNGRLGLAEENNYEGQGLSHCAACDGPLYAGARVVVAGHDRWAVQEALDLAAGGLRCPIEQRTRCRIEGGEAATWGRADRTEVTADVDPVLELHDRHHRPVERDGERQQRTSSRVECGDARARRTVDLGEVTADVDAGAVG